MTDPKRIAEIRAMARAAAREKTEGPPEKEIALAAETAQGAEHKDSSHMNHNDTPPVESTRCVGATPDEWEHFARTLGLESDLLPYVADPSARRSERSKISEPGKVPSRFNQADEMVGIPSWTSHVATDKSIARWSADSRLGICIITRNVKAIDIDIQDPVVSARVREFLELGLGKLPIRRRPNSGKCLLAFRLSIPFPKRVIKTAHGIIELLSEKQQFLALGQHPSGVRYEWLDTDGVLGLPTEIPELTMAEVDAAWQALIEAYALPNGASEERNGMVPTKPRFASDLQDPTVAWLDANDWVVGHDRSGRVDINCPFADGHTPGSGGATSTSYFPAGVGGFLQGHFRCLHASCSHRTDGDFLEATGYSASGFDVVAPQVDAAGNEVQELPALERDKKGRAEATKANVVKALQHPGLTAQRVGFDHFRGTLMISDQSGQVWRAFADEDYTALALSLEEGQARFKEIPTERMRAVVKLVARTNQFDSAQQWLDGLQWDGVPRIDSFCCRYFGADDTPYARAVGRYLWSALAGRVIEPGCKADMLPTLVGAQGSVKTTAVEALAPIPESFVEIDLSRKDEDLARMLRGKLVGEIAELRGLRTKDAESIKAWIARRVEEGVKKFEEFSSRFERRCMFIGTTNDPEFLDDITGERRHLPLEVKGGDAEAIARDRDQLWAEAAALFRAEGVCWQEAKKLAEPEHAKFKVVDPWQERVEDWLSRDEMDQKSEANRGQQPVRVSDVLLSALGLKLERVTKREEMRVARVLTALGYRKARNRLAGEVTRYWVKEARA